MEGRSPVIIHKIPPNMSKFSPKITSAYHPLAQKKKGQRSQKWFLDRPFNFIDSSNEIELWTSSQLFHIKPLSKQRWFHPLPMHLRWRPWCATSPIQFQGQFQGGPVKLDSMWQHRLTRLVRDRYMYSIRITV